MEEFIKCRLAFEFEAVLYFSICQSFRLAALQGYICVIYQSIAKMYVLTVKDFNEESKFSIFYSKDKNNSEVRGTFYQT